MVILFADFLCIKTWLPPESALIHPATLLLLLLLRSLLQPEIKVEMASLLNSDLSSPKKHCTYFHMQGGSGSEVRSNVIYIGTRLVITFAQVA